MSTNDIIILLNESASMDQMNDGPVNVVNEFIDIQKEVDDGALLTLWKFNSTVTCVVNEQPLQGVEKFSDYKTDGLTALYMP